MMQADMRPNDRSDDPDQENEDLWALRILSCPRRTCPRQRRCQAGGGPSCPGHEAYPMSEDLSKSLLRNFRLLLTELLAESDAGEVAVAAGRARRDAAAEPRIKLAFERARRVLGKGRRTPDQHVG
jgi:hypothetical protein